MAYGTHHLWVMGGHSDPTGTGAWDEVWQCGIRGLPSFTGGMDEVGYMTAMAANVNGWWTDPAKGCSPLSRLEYMKFNQIGPDGRYTDPTHPHTFDYATPHTGAGTSSYPDFCSLAYSWRTGRLRGPGSNGRIYVPNAWPFTAGEAIVQPTAQNDAAAAAVALLVQIRGAYTGSTFEPCVASKVDGSVTPITSVRVGRVIDVQRRRRDKVAESYVTLGLP